MIFPMHALYFAWQLLCGQVRVVAPEMTKLVCRHGALKRKLVICFGEKPTIKRCRPLPTTVDVTVQNPCGDWYCVGL